MMHEGTAGGDRGEVVAVPSAPARNALAIHAPAPKSHAPPEWSMTVHPSVRTFWEDSSHTVEALWQAFSEAAARPLNRNTYAGHAASHMLSQDEALFHKKYAVEIPDDWFDLMNYLTLDAGSADEERYMYHKKRSRYEVAREILVELLERHHQRAAVLRSLFANEDPQGVFSRASVHDGMDPGDRGLTRAVCASDDEFRERAARAAHARRVVRELTKPAFPFALPAPAPRKRGVAQLAISHADHRASITDGGGGDGSTALVRAAAAATAAEARPAAAGAFSSAMPRGFGAKLNDGKLDGVPSSGRFARKT